MREWQPIETAPLDVEIETKIDDVFGARNETRIVGYRRGPDSRIMWFLPDRSMYVYYEPTHWRHSESPPHDRE